MGVRARSSKLAGHPSARPLKNQAFAESLSGYRFQSAEQNDRLTLSRESKASRLLASPEAGGQYFSAGEYWTNTRSK